mmetsp:Transcript_24503/g.29693  ORF Transcript_24503/g.29693 Transcript_24503/m.29693 type:complete len:226 (-) Transcript_24503:163-840(-)|eukprot:CAMPEP_0197865130 /NCGR_PEP_ID=MMETSP1438-20131217/43485_1 /TAXON_ID=1461541 /ORGANISM="Pterosperma sp., Strain CCMP1384" /LENGTH=225 /DNA_ID=CAMNT_0043483545 /DNA_START=220 /DNA_END=897 /DNA_ORIENTATION=-
MNDADYERQIYQMVQFIKQEAEEKASEIGVAADEEFNIQKQQMLEAEKLKIRKEYEKKDGQVEVKKKIEYSTQLNSARLQVLQARSDSVNTVVEEVKQQLLQISANVQVYSKLLVDLIVQGALKLGTSEVGVCCREVDLPLVKQAIGNVQAEWQSLAPGRKLPSIQLNPNFLPPPPSAGDQDSCFGGVVVTAEGGRIKCSQTLDDRLKKVIEHNTPLVRATLFAQ